MAMIDDARGEWCVQFWCSFLRLAQGCPLAEELRGQGPLPGAGRGSGWTSIT